MASATSKQMSSVSPAIPNVRLVMVLTTITVSLVQTLAEWSKMNQAVLYLATMDSTIWAKNAEVSSQNVTRRV